MSSPTIGQTLHTWGFTYVAHLDVTHKLEPTPVLARATTRAGNLKLAHPLVVTVEPDDDAFLAKCAEVPQVFGLGDTPDDARDAFGRELESLWADLNETGASFTDEWVKLKERLVKIIGG